MPDIKTALAHNVTIVLDALAERAASNILNGLCEIVYVRTVMVEIGGIFMVAKLEHLFLAFNFGFFGVQKRLFNFEFYFLCF